MNRTDAIIEKYFEEGLLTLTGARDKYGNHIITLPVHHLVSMETMDARYFVAVLQKYLVWENLVYQHNPGIAVLLNLKNTRKIVIQIVVDALAILESKKKTNIQTVYIVKPDTRNKSRLLKKLLGVKPPKLDHIRHFQILLVKTVEILRNHIEPSQLTIDYGGVLYHDHNAWFQFYKRVEPTLSSTKGLLIQLPGIKEKVDLWEEYELTDETTEQLNQTLTDIQEQFDTILKEYNFESIVEDCKQLLHVLEASTGEQNTHTEGDVNGTVISPVVVTLRKFFHDLTDFHHELTRLYKTTESRIYSSCQLLKCQEKAAKIIKSIKDDYQVQFSKHPAVGATLTQAELYRNHFTSSLYQPCKNLISDATDILEELKSLNESDLRKVITKDLISTIEPFTIQLQNIHDTYIQIHIFHTLLNKFSKWYKKVLKFLPEYLRKLIDKESPDKLVSMPEEWNYTVETFLTKHPPPREEHIAKIDLEIPTMVSRQLKQQAHCLAIRTKLLQRLLTSKRLPVKLINAVMKWKDELHPPAAPIKLKPQIKVHSPSSASSTSDQEEEEKQRIKLKSPRRKSLPNMAVHPDPGLKSLKASVQNESDKLQAQGSEDENPTILKSEQTANSKSKSFIREDLKIDNPSEGASKERFIRLTFTPKDFEDEGAARRFTFNDIVHEGSESGIEVVDAESEDPYDTIIDKIREVSNSQISSDLKLKYVTNLLRCSLRDAELQKPRYVKNPRRTRNHSRLKSAYGKSVGNLLDMDGEPNLTTPKMSSFSSLQNLNVLDDSITPTHSEFCLPTMRPTSSLHNLYSELERPQTATGMSKWYHAYDRPEKKKPSEEDFYNERLQQDLERLQRCKSERLAEESILEKDKQRLDEIAMEAELMKQDRVEYSLRRSHDILQNEELRLGSSDMSDQGEWPNMARNFEDLMPRHREPYQRPKSDQGYDSVSSPRTFSPTTASSRPVLSSKTSYEDPDYLYDPTIAPKSRVPETTSQNMSKASQALSSVLPRFDNAEEIDKFCVQLKKKTLHDKTVVEVHHNGSGHPQYQGNAGYSNVPRSAKTGYSNQPSTSQYRREENFLDDDDFY